MYKFLQGVDLSFWTVYSTPIFLGLFLLYTVYIFRNANKNKYQQLASLPLDDERKRK